MTRFDSLFSFLRRGAARWIATPFWNLRFSLGMRIGGFTHAQRTYDERSHPNG